jgi:16S rRNA processing protein RimM
VNTACDADKVTIIGRVNGAFGVRGWIKISSFTDPATNILNYLPWLMQQDDGWKVVEPLTLRAQGTGFVAQLPGIDDRDAAAALKGQLIAVNASALPDAGLDEYYWKDLIGLEVLDTAGAPLGTVVDMLATGANDVLVVELNTGGAQELIPFHRRFVPELDLAAGYLKVDWAIGELI